MTMFSRSLLNERLKKFDDTEYKWGNLSGTVWGNLTKAAVLVPLFMREGEVFVWLTRRAPHLQTAGGDVAFPGGKQDEGDKDECHMALRESHEEIGLKEEHVQIIGQILPRITTAMVLVTPVLGIVSDRFKPALNKAEVADIFYLPLERFLSAKRHSASVFEYRGNKWLDHSFEDEFEGKNFTTWGLAAAVCVEVAMYVYQRMPTFQWVLEPGPSPENHLSFQRMYLERMGESLGAKPKMTNFTSSLVHERIVKFNDTEYVWRNLKNKTMGKLRKAAILIPLFVKEGRVFVWLTERAKHLRNDGGHVAFPGGMKDNCDRDEIETALRESYEEIGLETDRVHVLCQLLPRINRRLSLITPIVGLVDEEFNPEINTAEVAAAFYVPLDRFLSSRGYKCTPYVNRGINWLVHYFDDDFKGQTFTTWGLTASICVEVAMCIYQREPNFVWDSEPKLSTLENPFSLQQFYLQQLEEKLENELVDSKL